MARLDADMLLKAYAVGVFPMAQSRDGKSLSWYDPEWRGIVPLDAFRVPRRLARTIRSGRYEIRFDTVFSAVMAACAAPRAGGSDTWINGEITALYTALHARGHAHSVEWQAGFTASHWGRRSSARACSPPNAMPARLRSRRLSRG
jgi:leucyl/phenylalanyl-tRNA---protein transferase